MKKHITILVSPTGEEFFDAYGPMTKDRAEATEYHTNNLTLARPSRLGGGPHRPFWDCEIEAEKRKLKKYAGWTYRHEPII